MKNETPTLLVAIFILVFFQQVSFLVESIYNLCLLHLSMDARVLGMLFLYSPVFLLLFRKQVSNLLFLAVGLLFLLSSLMTPWVSTDVRIFTAGFAVCAFLLFLGFLFSRNESKKVNWIFSISLAVLLSVLLRVFGSTIDLSVSGPFKIIHLLLTLFGTLLLSNVINRKNKADEEAIADGNQSTLKYFIAAVGFMSGFILLYFAFTSPTVFTRWTETSYGFVHALYIPVIFAAMVLSGWRAKSIFRINKSVLLIVNLLFLLALVFSILRHTITFPPSVDSPFTIVASTKKTVDIPILFVLLLAPVIFFNMNIFASRLFVTKPSKLALPLTLASLFFSILIFMLIFTNVWGYVGAISYFFRNKFVLPFLLAGLGMILPLLFFKESPDPPCAIVSKKIVVGLTAAAGIAAIVFSIIAESPRPPARDNNELTLLSYNIQQGVDYYGKKNYAGQLAVIRRINPDILCLQESDVARISGGNSDVVRFFADKLNYFSYYGPKTVTGTYGTAILSRYPLENCRTFFTYSDVDEIGTAACEIRVSGKKIAIFNSHPAGSPDAQQAHVNALLDVIKDCDNVFAAGDYNFRQDSPYYARMAAVLQDSWLARWPSGCAQDHISNAGGLENSILDKTDRIDHIFLSHNFKVLESVYLPAPASQSDHPAHWVVVRWEQ